MHIVDVLCSENPLTVVLAESTSDWDPAEDAPFDPKPPKASRT